MDKGQENYILMNNGVVAEHHVMLQLREGGKTPTQEEIDAEVKRVQAEYDAQEYARKRQAEYPSIEELVVALYDTDDKADIEAKRAAVKAKYPKP
jgi:hypothetical protein|tara:strand:- start:518 stop:802 length:285 start_codon:yes stop_codon:yes gene_type:complete